MPHQITLHYLPLLFIRGDYSYNRIRGLEVGTPLQYNFLSRWLLEVRECTCLWGNILSVIVSICVRSFKLLCLLINIYLFVVDIFIQCNFEWENYIDKEFVDKYPNRMGSITNVHIHDIKWSILFTNLAIIYVGVSDNKIKAIYFKNKIFTTSVIWCDMIRVGVGFNSFLYFTLKLESYTPNPIDNHKRLGIPNIF